MNVTIRLKIEPPGAKGEAAELLLAGVDALVGRDASCDVIVEAQTVSGRHGLLKGGAAGYTYTDLDSRNGSALIRAGGDGEPEVVLSGNAVPVGPGDVLLLGAADSPVRVVVEAGAAPFAAAAAPERTVVARAPLADLRAGVPDALVELAGRSMSAGEPGELGAEALAYLDRVFPDAAARGVLVCGAGFRAEAGAGVPRGLQEQAENGREVLLLQSAADTLPATESIASSGIQAAVVAPLRAGETFHGVLAAWSPAGVAALAAEALEPLSVAASLVALQAAQIAVRHAGRARQRELEDEVARLVESKAGRWDVDPVGVSPAFCQARDLAKAVAPSNVPVLVQGETGTGKEVLARAVHRWSRRAVKPFVAVNCAALPENLLESELFGHVRGAFTGASNERRGLFEEADGGTVFLDEIGEMPPPMQAKLLRVLQDGEVRRVGSTRPARVDVRVISATNRDLKERAERGEFREDLMYRLNAVTVLIPPLREREGDVLLLAHALLGRACVIAHKQVPGFTPDALAALSMHPFPGNVRELENELVRAVALTPEGEPVAATAFSESLAARDPSPAAALPAAEEGSLKAAVERAERQAVIAAVADAGGNMTRAAEQLGLTRPGLYKVMERLGLR